jgi:hypothetical protein
MSLQPGNGLQWMVTANRHIIPLNDFREHTESTSCWCHPVHDDEGNSEMHNSLDNRELYETGALNVH